MVGRDQFEVREIKDFNSRRYSFCKRTSLGVIELKNPADENTDIWSAYNQLQTYKDNIPDLFNTNGVLVISDGIQARMGSLTANQERFMRWRTIDGETVDPLENIKI